MNKPVFVLTSAILFAASFLVHAAEKETTVVTYVAGQGERCKN